MLFALAELSVIDISLTIENGNYSKNGTIVVLITNIKLMLYIFFLLQNLFKNKKNAHFDERIRFTFTVR